MAASLSRKAPPPEIGENFGLVYPLEDVQLAVYGLEAWGVLPYAGGLFDQPQALIDDILRYVNARDRLEWDNKAASPDGVPDHEEQLTDIKGLTL